MVVVNMFTDVFIDVSSAVTEAIWVLTDAISAFMAKMTLSSRFPMAVGLFP